MGRPCVRLGESVRSMGAVWVPTGGAMLVRHVTGQYLVPVQHQENACLVVLLGIGRNAVKI